MITEDYCSYEVAQLLKEKGFDEECFALYNPDGMLIQSGIRLNNIQVGRVEGSYSAPTHQMAMKWLREKGIEIIVYPFSNIVKENMLYTADICTSIVTRQQGHLRGMWKTYEEAVEAALKYTLENLI